MGSTPRGGTSITVLGERRYELSHSHVRALHSTRRGISFLPPQPVLRGQSDVDPPRSPILDSLRTQHTTNDLGPDLQDVRTVPVPSHLRSRTNSESTGTQSSWASVCVRLVRTYATKTLFSLAILFYSTSTSFSYALPAYRRVHPDHSCRSG